MEKYFVNLTFLYKILKCEENAIDFYIFIEMHRNIMKMKQTVTFLHKTFEI